MLVEPLEESDGTFTHKVEVAESIVVSRQNGMLVVPLESVNRKSSKSACMSESYVTAIFTARFVNDVEFGFDMAIFFLLLHELSYQVSALVIAPSPPSSLRQR